MNDAATDSPDPAPSDPLRLSTAFEPRYGEPVAVADGVWRITAPNASPFTFHGTNTYLVGNRTSVALVDPGPDDDRHLAALLAAIDGRRVEAVLLTHTHRDHTALVPRLLAATGGPPLLAEGPHRAARPLAQAETNALDAAGDVAIAPNRRLGDGEAVDLAGRTIGAIATPGHTANHLAFDLGGGVVLSGDHVMAWSTSIVAPPDGSMIAYMESLDRMLARNDRLLLPGHGGPVERPRAFLRGLKAHRRMREGAILARLAAGDRRIPAIVAAIYRSTDPRLHGAAALSVFAHLEDLVARGLALTDGPPLLDGLYHPA